MDSSRNTPGVERILNHAQQLASALGEVELHPKHLLMGLIREECRGTEILGQHGLTVDVVTHHFSFPVEPENEPSESPSQLPFAESMQQVGKQAQKSSARQGRYAELNSEHLLLGLVAVDSEVSGLLKLHGLTMESLKPLVDESEGHPDSPVSVDFELTEVQKPTSDETDLFRILDAAINRVREGVRVLEDYVRFARDEGHLTSLLKSWRHDLRTVLTAIDERRLLSSRETTGDVGTGLSTPGERQRHSMKDVVVANCKRVQEGLRTLEEYSKILSPSLGDAISQLRYRFYTLEKILTVDATSTERLQDRCLYLLITPEDCCLDWKITAHIALNAGFDILQLREKRGLDREIVERGRLLREWTRETGALLIINDRPDLAVLTDADGVHVGQEELTVRQARRIIGPDRLVGVSTHSLEQAQRAVEDGADYLGVGPVFPSQTKSFSQFAGLKFVRQVAENFTLPWFAIGGITS
ncbi:MAG: thiamine phosphate synthase, partial [Planctomycetaceae bacterium]|nr:thiamine phosphate synthase [Planctomycetaceae bacterium]